MLTAVQTVKKHKTKKTMRTCTNCGSQITCGCQDRTASNGAKVCSSCVALYEQQLTAAALEQQSKTQYYSSNTNENLPS